MTEERTEVQLRRPKDDGAMATAASEPQTRVVARYNYEAEMANDLSFQEGDQLVVTDKRGSWWYAQNPRTSQIGFIPSNYMELSSGPEFEVPSPSNLHQLKELEEEPCPTVHPSPSNLHQLKELEEETCPTGHPSPSNLYNVVKGLEEEPCPTGYPSPSNLYNVVKGLDKEPCPSVLPSPSNLHQLKASEEESYPTVFSSLSNSQNVVEELDKEPWYFPDLGRKEAETLLKATLRHGSFLVRNSSGGGYSLSVLSNTIHHFKIRNKGQGFYLHVDAVMPTVQSLIQHYKMNPLNTDKLHLGQPCMQTAR